MSFVRKLLRKALYLIHSIIARFWVEPLEAWFLHRLEKLPPGSHPSPFMQWVAWCANIGRVLILDVRLKVFRWANAECSIIYIGNGTSIETLRHILFPSPPQVDELQKVFLWQVPSMASRLVQSDELVVCELNEILSPKPQNTPLAFIVPDFINQVLENIQRPLDDIMAAMNSSLRWRIHRIQSAGFTYEFTRSPADFELFYHRMYRPYIESRYDGRGIIIHDYQEVQRLFQSGGLVLVKLDHEPVCAMLCQISGKTCEAKLTGVLDGRFDLVKQGSTLALWWFILDWARKQGAEQLVFGASLAHTADGVFTFKRQWGTRVMADYRHHSRWHFLGSGTSESLRTYLDRKGFITGIHGKYYRLVLLPFSGPNKKADLTSYEKEALTCGLDGIATISPDGLITLPFK